MQEITNTQTAVMATGIQLKENIVSGLTTGVPYIIAVVSVFWAYSFIKSKLTNATGFGAYKYEPPYSGDNPEFTKFSSGGKTIYYVPYDK
jgi:hypothetical protein